MAELSLASVQKSNPMKICFFALRLPIRLLRRCDCTLHSHSHRAERIVREVQANAEENFLLFHAFGDEAGS